MNYINCISCGNPIPEKRLEILPNTKKCVSCSDTGKKGALTVMKGTGDNTWVETIPMSPEECEKRINLDRKLNKSDPFGDSNFSVDI